MLADKTIRHISSGEGNDYFFDFSTISGDLYETLFRSLQKYCLKNVEAIGFSCHEISKYINRFKSGYDLPPDIRKSIANTKIHYIKNMVELLYYILPRAPKITSLTLSTIPMKAEHIQRLSFGLGKPNNLSTLVFRKIKITLLLILLLIQLYPLFTQRERVVSH